MKNLVLNLIAFAALAITPALTAQDIPEKLAVSDTTIGPNDSVTIVALGADEVSKAWRVSSTGELSLPMIGKIYVAGKTTEQLEQELTAKLRLYIREPEVTVYVSDYQSQTVTVQGAVEKPGRFQTEGQKTLLGVLMMAGGTKSPGPTVTVTRAAKYGSIPLNGARRSLESNTSIAELPIGDVLDASSAAANLIIKPDDVVFVSVQQQQLVYIMGEVNHVGAVELVTRNSVSIVQVLAAAGGMTKIAAASKTTILRKDPEGRYAPVDTVDLKKIMVGKEKDKLLRAGDIVVIPTNNVKSVLQTVLMAAATTAVTSSIFILTKY